MEVDLVTIFPKVVLETHKEEKGKLVRDPGAICEIYYLGAHITSYKQLLLRNSRHKSRIMECIKQTQGAIVDSSRQPLDDYIVVVDENIAWDLTEPPNPSSIDLLTYFLNLRQVDTSLGLDFAKIMLLPDRHEYRYINNCAMHWSKYSPWVLPIKKSYQVKIKLDQEVEGVLEKALCTVHKNQPELYKKLMTAIDLFNQSCRLSLFHRNSSLVLIVSALEALFNIPVTSTKKVVLTYAMQVHWGFDEDTLKWTNKLYELRNSIVHGEVVTEKKREPSSDQYYSYYEIARNLFGDCLRSVLELYGGLSISLEDKSSMKKRLLGLVASNKKKMENAINLLKRVIRGKRDYSNRASLFREFLEAITALDPEDNSAKKLLVPYLEVVFLVVREEIESERETVESLPMSNTKLGIQDRIPHYDRIIDIFKQMEAIRSWSSGKLSKYYRTQLDTHIKTLLQVTTDLTHLASVTNEMYGVGLSLGEFLSKCLGAVRTFSNL